MIKIEAVARSIGVEGGRAKPIPTETTSQRDIMLLFDRGMAPGNEFEPADLVVYNVANNRRVDFRELSAETFEEFLRFGGFPVGRKGARRLMPLGRGTVLITGASGKSCMADNAPS